MSNRLTRVIKMLRRKNDDVRRRKGIHRTFYNEFVVTFAVYALVCLFIFAVNDSNDDLLQ